MTELVTYATMVEVPKTKEFADFAELWSEQADIFKHDESGVHPEWPRIDDYEFLSAALSNAKRRAIYKVNGDDYGPLFESLGGAILSEEKPMIVFVNKKALFNGYICYRLKPELVTNAARTGAVVQLDDEHAKKFMMIISPEPFGPSILPISDLKVDYFIWECKLHDEPFFVIERSSDSYVLPIKSARTELGISTNQIIAGIKKMLDTAEKRIDSNWIPPTMMDKLTNAEIIGEFSI